MLNPELDSHAVLGTLLNGEAGLLQLLESFGGIEVDDDGITVGNEKRKLENHDLREHHQLLVNQPQH